MIQTERWRMAASTTQVTKIESQRLPLPFFVDLSLIERLGHRSANPRLEVNTKPIKNQIKTNKRSNNNILMLIV